MATEGNLDNLAARHSRPLWLGAISLAVIALTMLVGLFVLAHELRTTQAAIGQLHQQVVELQKSLGGLGGLLGG